MLSIIPLIGLVVVVYNVIAILGGVEWLTSPLVTLTLFSGAELPVRLVDILVVTALLFLFVELLISVRAHTRAVINHSLSMIVLLVCVVEFLLVSWCGTAAFLYLTLIAMVDVMAGFSVSIIAARRDVGVDSDGSLLG